MTTATPEFVYFAAAHRGTANYNIKAHAKLPEGTTAEDAQAIADKFPKYVKVIGTTCSTYAGTPGQDDYRPFDCGYVGLDLNFKQNATTGEFNESAQRRWNGFRKALAEQGWSLEYRQPFTNSMDPADPRHAA